MMVRKREMVAMLTALVVVGWTASALADITLFNDDFDEYPGAPARWATYTSNPSNPNYKAEVAPESDFLWVGFGTEGVANAAVLVAGQDAYMSPKVHSGSDSVTYSVNYNQLSGWYAGVDLYVSDQKMDDSVPVARNMAPAGNYFRLRMKRNNDTEVNLSMFAGAAYLGYALIDVTGLNDPGVSREISLELNDTNFSVYNGAAPVLSGAHGVNLSGASDTAYMSMVQHTQYDSTSMICSHIDYARISSTIPEPATLILLGIGSLGLMKRRR